MHPCRFHTLTHSFPFSNIFPIYISQEILEEKEALDAIVSFFLPFTRLNISGI